METHKVVIEFATRNEALECFRLLGKLLHHQSSLVSSLFQSSLSKSLSMGLGSACESPVQVRQNPRIKLRPR